MTNTESNGKVNNPEGKKRRVKPESDLGGSNGVTESRVSTLPRTDNAGELAIRGNGLPGVPSSDPQRMAEIVSQGPSEVEYKVTLAEHKIACLNAFNKLLGRKLKIKGSPFIQSLIQQSYISWVRDNIDRLLNGGSDQIDFTSDQANVLRTMADQIIKRQATIASQPNQQQSKPTPTPISKPEPLKESVNVDSFRRANENFLQELAKMDREGPQF